MNLVAESLERTIYQMRLRIPDSVPEYVLLPDGILIVKGKVRRRSGRCQSGQLSPLFDH